MPNVPTTNNLNNRNEQNNRDEQHLTTRTVHQRHKSTGNLNMVAGTANMNVAAKRTAFGDRNRITAIDMKEIEKIEKNGHPGVKYTHKRVAGAIVSTSQENQPLVNQKDVVKKALLQPAQRPSRINPPTGTFRPRLTNRASVSTFVPYREEGPSREAGVEPRPQHSYDGKGATAVTGYIAPVIRQEVTMNQRLPPPHVPQHFPVIEEVPTRPSVTGNVTEHPVKKTQAVDITDQRILQKEQEQEHCSLQETSSTYHSARDQASRPTSSSSVLVHPIFVPVNEGSSRTSLGAEDEASYVDAVETQSSLRVYPLPGSFTSEHAPKPIIQSGVVTTKREPQFVDPHGTHPLQVSDYEEEDYYEDPGYTTAHSNRSKGDNTTTGITTVMFPPKLTTQGLSQLDAAKQYVDIRRTPEEIEEDKWDVSMVAEYGDEIFEYMKQMEMTLLPNPHYMDIQTEIQWSMRSVLMDWVIQVHTRFGLLPETLFLAINYIDRFLSYKVVSLGKLQLVGATAIFIAAKYEEINCPSVQEIVYMVDGGYTIEEILKAERFMLSMLDFELGWPGPMSFLRRISKADDYDLETRTLAKYFLEIVIMDERFVASPPSYIAAGAHCLSRLLLRKGDWTPSHVHYSGYTYSQLKPLVSMVLDCCRHARNHHCAVYEKYSDKRYRRASTYVEEEIKKGFILPYQQRISMPLSVDFYQDEATRVSYTDSQALKMPIPIHG
ncbi:hypothetical protein F5Y18DRAFT_151336 [Xylariaceae sp. FL1019]|nr:hypothetical protein F5Y18DRAFT_151336 [Xylariaceae sp. FL1019]